MAGISVFPMAEGAILRVSAGDVRLTIELSPVEITAILADFTRAARGSKADHKTVEALIASLPAPGRRVPPLL